jgi:hypothetical protein
MRLFNQNHQEGLTLRQHNNGLIPLTCHSGNRRPRRSNVLDYVLFSCPIDRYLIIAARTPKYTVLISPPSRVNPSLPQDSIFKITTHSITFSDALTHLSHRISIFSTLIFPNRHHRKNSASTRGFSAYRLDTDSSI